MENNKESIWITIPEEIVPPQVLPSEDAGVSPDQVKNKTFWGIGFIALIIFSVLLLAPQQLAGLLQGQLFNGGFQVVPDYEDQEELFGESTDSGDASETDADISDSSSASSNNVVGAEGDAVTIQITPLADTDAEVTDELTAGSEAQATADTMESVSTAGSIGGNIEDNTDTVDTEDGTMDSEGADAEMHASASESVSGTDSEITDTATEGAGVTSAFEEALGALGGVTDETETTIDTTESEEITGTEAESISAEADEEGGDTASNEVLALQAQLDSFKKMQEENQALIAQLAQMLQTGDLHGAGTQVSPSLLTGGQAQQFAMQNQDSNSVYRYNTHTVTVSPYDVLKQNQQAQAQVAQMQANVQYSGTIAYSNANYNPVLSTVQGQPDTGPKEAMILSILLASVGILVWGSLRAFRA